METAYPVTLKSESEIKVEYSTMGANSIGFPYRADLVHMRAEKFLLCPIHKREFSCSRCSSKSSQAMERVSENIPLFWIANCQFRWSTMEGDVGEIKKMLSYMSMSSHSFLIVFLDRDITDIFKTFIMKLTNLKWNYLRDECQNV